MESEVGPSADGWEDDPDDWGSLEEPIPTNKVQRNDIPLITQMVKLGTLKQYINSMKRLR